MPPELLPNVVPPTPGLSGRPASVQSCLERMRHYMALRGLRSNTVGTFTRCARGFLTHVGKMPTEITTGDVEGFLLGLAGRGH